MWHDLLVAFALLLVLEGVLPFLSPQGLRRTLLLVSQMSDQTLRFAGLTSMILGCLLLYAVN
jgi:uncharacterized protein YjeT (DUF2065 family)